MLLEESRKWAHSSTQARQILRGSSSYLVVSCRFSVAQGVSLPQHACMVVTSLFSMYHRGSRHCFHTQITLTLHFHTAPRTAAWFENPILQCSLRRYSTLFPAYLTIPGGLQKPHMIIGVLKTVCIGCLGIAFRAGDGRAGNEHAPENITSIRVLPSASSKRVHCQKQASRPVENEPAGAMATVCICHVSKHFRAIALPATCRGQPLLFMAATVHGRSPARVHHAAKVSTGYEATTKTFLPAQRHYAPMNVSRGVPDAGISEAG